MRRLIIREKLFQHEHLKKPARMRQVPFRGAGLRHGLNYESSVQSFADHFRKASLLGDTVVAVQVRESSDLAPLACFVCGVSVIEFISSSFLALIVNSSSISFHDSHRGGWLSGFFDVSSL